VKPQKNENIVLDIDSLAFGGRGVGRLGNWVVFVEGALPGQRLSCRITRVKKQYAEARAEEILRQSEHYVSPRCSHFGQCGGCSHQHLSYERQLIEKENQVREALRRIGNLSVPSIYPVSPSPQIFEYRNKMEFSFSRSQWLPRETWNKQNKAEAEGLFLGLHARGFYDKVVDIDRCHLMPALCSDILKTVRRIAQQSGRPVYSTRDHLGFWRYLVIRHFSGSNELMVNVITSGYDPRVAQQLKEGLGSDFPEISSLVYGTSENRSSVAQTDQEHLLAGKKTLTASLGGRRFEVSSGSFFQTNTAGAQELFELVAKEADLAPGETVYDLYCGAGTFSIYLSGRGAKFIGFESVPSAVEDARRNKALNEADDCQFVPGDLRDTLSNRDSLTERFGRPDVMIIDPPRAGMQPKTLSAVLQLLPERIVHISCNPATLARDLGILCANDYRLVTVRPVDMFPHTPHVEVVARLQRCG